MAVRPWLLLVSVVTIQWIFYVESASTFYEDRHHPHSVLLNNDDLLLSWSVDWRNDAVLFNVDNAFGSANQYFTFGFSKWGRAHQADLCLFDRDDWEQAIDQYTDKHGDRHRDDQQDWEVLRIDGRSVAFRRKFNTCDSNDLRLREGTMHVVWNRHNGSYTRAIHATSSHGSHHPKNPPSNNLSEKHIHAAPIDKDHGVTTIQILRSVPVIPEKDSFEVPITVDSVAVRPDNTYWCFVRRLDELHDVAHHMVQFRPIHTYPGLMHHMEVFHCDVEPTEKIPLYSGLCDDAPPAVMQCMRVIALWALGSDGFSYPPEAGLRLGGPEQNPYVRVELHYNNVHNRTGLVDSSGLMLRMTRHRRKYDIGIVELGLEYTDKMALPPGQVAFPLTGFCTPECTKVAFPAEGITIFGSQMHTHKRGVRMVTRHYRDGVEMGEVGRDDYYTHEFQEIRNLRNPVRVLPGDALLTTCYYDTTDEDHVVLGGFTAADEMCVNYVQYYPATDLQVCKSSVGEKELAHFFEYMKVNNHQTKIQLDGARSTNYAAIDWTRPHVDELFGLYTYEPLSMQCNRSNGDRFSGAQWEGNPIVPYDLQLKPSVVQGMCPEADNDPYNPPLDEGRQGYLGESEY